MGIRIITDSICDVPKDYVNRYNIRVMPLVVNFGDQSYRDGIDLTLEEFLSKLEKSEALPTTSQVPPAEFLEVYKEEIALGNKVISIHGSSQMSGTYNSAVIAKEQIGGQDIYVIDSMGITLGAGMLVIKAARLAKEGLEPEEIVKEIEAGRQNMKHLIIVDTLKYLHKGGRLSLSAAVAGSILNIKPILTVVHGKLELSEKARGIKKAIAVVLSTLKDNGWTLDGKVVGINHIADLEHMGLLEEELKKEYNIKEIIRGEVGSVVATHGGPGAVAFYFEI
ncbi:MAG: DegV family protein [Clostridiaceae bacterium]|jgi:DegV family protein with EDD domain|nr:DegV family protein [Clostridiaceae bacterium]